jgi:UDP:flavonoid glycosyltransferase YjiC (YdhE family)
VGLLQVDALNVLREESAHAYEAFHEDWDDRVAREAEALTEMRADLVLANVPYLPLAGAARAHVPAIALCSLNWAEVYRHFFARRAGADRILTEMLIAYNQARYFLRPEPSIPMPGLANAKPIGPIAQVGRNRRAEIAEALGPNENKRLILVSLGGIDYRLPVELWPVLPDIRLLLPRAWRASHPQAIDLESLNMPFIDLLGSCDALITKTGYGSFVESACAGVPVLYLERADWVETPVLVPWLQSHCRCLAINSEQLRYGDIIEPLDKLLAQPAPARVRPTGLEEAVGEIIVL